VRGKPTIHVLAIAPVPIRSATAASTGLPNKNCQARGADCPIGARAFFRVLRSTGVPEWSFPPWLGELFATFIPGYGRHGFSRSPEAGAMCWKRYFLAFMVAFSLTTVFDILWNAFILRDVFLQNARFWRPPDELNALVPLGWLSTLLVMALMAAAFVRLGGSGLRSGLRFGVFLGLAGAISAYGLATLVP
jgi:hypothetical protein